MTRALLLRGSVFLQLDPRVEGVIVPPRFASEPVLVLEIGLDLPVPIPDLRVDGVGVFGTLNFGRPFPCMVPWDAIFGVFGPDKRGMSWPESFPPELVERRRREREAGARRAAFREVNEPSEPALDEEDESAAAKADVEAEVAAEVAAEIEAEERGAGSDEPPAPTPLRARPALSVVDGPGRRSDKGRSKGAKRELPPYLKVIK